MQLRFREVNHDSWTDFAILFAERGGPKSCWCMVWRASSAEAKHRDGSSRRVQIQSRVDAGVPIGLLGYLNDQPITWCSIAPRDTYRNLGGPDVSATESIWSLACMFTKREYRGQGLTVQVIQAAITHAKTQGATSIEAYPVDKESPSFRFMGFVDVFSAAGFHEIGRVGIRRHVMRFDF
jgi:GNAT superfamily N-acetyltransferase